MNIAFDEIEAGPKDSFVARESVESDVTLVVDTLVGKSKLIILHFKTEILTIVTQPKHVAPKEYDTGAPIDGLLRK